MESFSLDLLTRKGMLSMGLAADVSGQRSAPTLRGCLQLDRHPYQVQQSSELMVAKENRGSVTTSYQPNHSFYSMAANSARSKPPWLLFSPNCLIALLTVRGLISRNNFRPQRTPLEAADIKSSFYDLSTTTTAGAHD